MVRYTAAKAECEAMVSYIDAIINTAMNGGDPMTVQQPQGSCSGSCATSTQVFCCCEDPCCLI